MDNPLVPQINKTDNTDGIPLASDTNIQKLQVMQNAALRTATGGTRDTNIQHLHNHHHAMSSNQFRPSFYALFPSIVEYNEVILGAVMCDQGTL